MHFPEGLKNTPLYDDLFFLGELKNCTRCRSIRYCGRSCQRSEFKMHNDDCQFIKNTIDELLKIEETYKQFKLR